jgi:anti-sigma28 factor (negative regulator of flagellin synthesis)
MAKSNPPKIAVSGGIPEMHLDMPLDEAKIAQIHKCIANGHLKISLSHVDLAKGRLGESWLYD